MRDKTLASLAKLLVRAGLPAEQHGKMIEGISTFTTAMVVLMQANEEEAQNYITFSMDTPAGKKYELTVRESEGKTPCEVIGDMEDRISLLEGMLSDALRAASLGRDRLATFEIFAPDVESRYQGLLSWMKEEGITEI